MKMRARKDLILFHLVLLFRPFVQLLALHKAGFLGPPRTEMYPEVLIEFYELIMKESRPGRAWTYGHLNGKKLENTAFFT